MSEPEEIRIEVPRPGTEEQLKKAIDAKLQVISTELRERGDQGVVVTIRTNHQDPGPQTQSR
jgi:hypothetical protein